MKNRISELEKQPRKASTPNIRRHSKAVYYPHENERYTV